MTQRNRLYPLLVVILSLFFVAGCGATAKKDIATRIEESNKPVITWGVKTDTNLFGLYNIQNQDIEGFDVDIAKAITDEITNGEGEADFVEVSSKTRISLLKNGNIDAIIATMTITDERKKVIDFSDVYFDAGQSLLVANDSPIENVESLEEGATVLAVKGANSAANLKKHAPQVRILELENYSEAFTALASGQGEAMTTDNAILLGIIDQNPGYRLAGEAFTEEPYGIGIDKGQDDFLEEVNTALETIKKNGVYDEIYDKWFGGLM